MNFEELGKEIMKNGKADKLKAVANSEEGKRIGAMLNPAEVEKAAMSGDDAALRGILRQVLSTDEGKKLAQKLSEALK